MDIIITRQGYDQLMGMIMEIITFRGYNHHSSYPFGMIIFIMIMLTFDGYYQLRYDGQDLLWPPTSQQVLNSLEKKKNFFLLPQFSQNKIGWKPERRRRHTGAGFPSVRQRREGGSSGSPGTREAPSKTHFFWKPVSLFAKLVKGSKFFGKLGNVLLFGKLVKGSKLLENWEKFHFLENW